jgi:pSer/pThr/pTyr-binding forkhead associated (FHA) protein
MKLWLQHLGAMETAPKELCLEHFPFVIGRRSDSDGCLPFAFISRRHCQFVFLDNRILVQDLESYNGTFVNGKQAGQPLPVQDGDEITLGPISFRVVMPAVLKDTAEVQVTPTNTEMQRLKV